MHSRRHDTCTKDSVVAAAFCNLLETTMSAGFACVITLGTYNDADARSNPPLPTKVPCTAPKNEQRVHHTSTSQKFGCWGTIVPAGGELAECCRRPTHFQAAEQS